jgi:hypothetical protein
VGRRPAARCCNVASLTGSWGGGCRSGATRAPLREDRGRLGSAVRPLAPGVAICDAGRAAGRVAGSHAHSLGWPMLWTCRARDAWPQTAVRMGPKETGCRCRPAMRALRGRSTRGLA